MTLDIENAIKAGCSNMDVDLDAISETIDDDIRPREIGTERWWFWHTAGDVVFESCSTNTSANSLMADSSTFRVGIADSFGARIAANGGVTVFVVWTVVIANAFRQQNWADTNTRWTFY